MDTFVATPDAGKDTLETTIYDYAVTGGKFVALTTDAGFVDMLLNLLRVLGVSKKSLEHCLRLDDLFALLHKEPQTRFIICLEYLSADANMGQVMDSIVRLCPRAGLIILTQEIDPHTIALLIEQGAHNIITKPIVTASLLEKLAYVIAPQGKLSRLIDKAKKLLEMDNWGEALMVADRILEKKPDSAAGYMIKGDAYMGLDMALRAEEMYQKASENAEQYLSPLKRLASLYEQTGNVEKQLQCLQRLNEISPLNTQRLLQMGALEISRGNSMHAESMFEHVILLAQREATERLSRLSSQIADICAKQDPEMAVRYSRKALALKKGNLGAMDVATVNILGISLRKQGKWQEAITEYRRVFAVVPDNAGLLYNMALAYSEGQEIGKALVIMQKALKLDPDLPMSGKNVAYNIGAVFQKAGQDGSPYFKKAYEQDPNDQALWQALRRAQDQAALASGGQAAQAG